LIPSSPSIYWGFGLLIPEEIFNIRWKSVWEKEKKKKKSKKAQWVVKTFSVVNHFLKVDLSGSVLQAS